jgi:hypothetical protein
MEVEEARFASSTQQAPALLPSAPLAADVDMEREGAQLVRTSTVPVAHKQAIAELKNLKLI